MKERRGGWMEGGRTGGEGEGGHGWTDGVKRGWMAEGKEDGRTD